jgi:SulP family sulfate permease
VRALAIVAGSVFAVGVAVRRWLPRWPATATGLLIGMLLGGLLDRAGENVAMIGDHPLNLQMPAWAGFNVFAMPGIDWVPLSGALVGQAVILGTIMFLNSALTVQILSQQDDRPADKGRLPFATASASLAAALIGSVPLSGAAQASLVAARHARLGPPVMVCMTLVAIAAAVSGVLGHVPIAAIAGALLCEAWFLVDRGSVKLLTRWMRREPLGVVERENLALVAAVTLTAVLLNIVAAVVVGFLLGLLLFAARNAVRPARAVLNGTQISSNCARPRGDIHQLGRHGHELRVVQLEGDLFFVTVTSLEQLFRTVIGEARCIVVDWTGVRHVDSSVVAALDKIERLADLAQVPLFHVDPGRSSADVASALQLDARRSRVAEDLDHALEQAENHLLSLYGTDNDAPATTRMDAVSLLRGLDEKERLQIEGVMEQRLFRAGEVVIDSGSASDELMIVLQGSASVLVPGPERRAVRLAGVRRGAVIGELAFLDRAARSATVLAEEDLVVAVLTREQYDQLSQSAPKLVQKLLANLALDLAARLRHTNRLATARQAGR